MDTLKAIPWPLRILSVFLLLWAAMTIVVIVSMPDREIALLGWLFSGRDAVAIVVPVLIDIVSPLVFVYAVFKKLSWGATFGMAYNGVFILNNIVTVFTHGEHFGIAVYFPLVISTAFFLTIFSQRKYFVLR